MRILLYIIALLAFVSCEPGDNRNKGVAVEVNGAILLQSELEAAIPQGLSTADSTRMVEEFTEQWVIQQLVVQKAELNVANLEEIRRLVDSYKNQLLVEHYLQLLVERKAEIIPSSTQIEEYYNENKAYYVLPESIIKGVFLVIPQEAAGVDEIRDMLKEDEIDRSAIEAFCLKNAAKADFFTDKWVSFNQIKKHLPELTRKEEAIIKQKSLFESNDSVFQYIVKVDDYILKGDISPLIFVEKEIKEYLLTINKVNYLQRMEKDLYDDAKQKGIIKYNK